MPTADAMRLFKVSERLSGQSAPCSREISRSPVSPRNDLYNLFSERTCSEPPTSPLVPMVGMQRLSGMAPPVIYRALHGGRSKRDVDRLGAELEAARKQLAAPGRPDLLGKDGQKDAINVRRSRPMSVEPTLFVASGSVAVSV